MHPYTLNPYDTLKGTLKECLIDLLKEPLKESKVGGFCDACGKERCEPQEAAASRLQLRIHWGFVQGLGFRGLGSGFGV